MDEKLRFRTMVMAYAKDLAVAYKPEVANLGEFLSMAHAVMLDILEPKVAKPAPEKPKPAKPQKEASPREVVVEDTGEVGVMTSDGLVEDGDFFVDEEELKVKTLKTALNERMDAAKVPKEHKKPLYDFVIEGKETVDRLENFVKNFGDGLMAYKKYILANKSK